MIILSSYPLSRSNLGALSLPEDARFLTLSALRVEPPLRLLRTLRGARVSRLRIVLQEPTERAVLPLMLTLAALARADGIEVHDATSGRTESVGRMRAAFGVFGIVSATISGRVALWRLRAVARGLLRAEPLAFDRVAGDHSLYLKTNLMLGAKAGGSIGHIAGVIDELYARDSAMLLLAPEFPAMVDQGVRFEPVPALQAYGLPAEINHFRFNAPCVRTGSRALRAERFDFIYQRLTLGNIAGVLLSRRHHVPLVIEYNGSEVWVARHWGYRLTFEKLASALEDVCLRHAHRVVAVSRVLADELVARGVPAERVVWYPNCIDPRLFDPARRAPAGAQLRQRFGIAADDVVCIFVGTFGAWHGAEVLAEAAGLCLAGRGEGPRLRFVFVGDGVRLPAVRERLAAEAERGDVVFTGLVPQHEAPDWLAAADIYCSPHVPPSDGSAFFGSPTKLFEYMAMEGAIVASDLDQIGEVLAPALREEALADARNVGGDETAVLLPPGDAAALARAIAHLARDPALRRRLGRAARARALERYTWRRHVDVILDSLR